MTRLNTVYDFLWVIQAFLRGKVLRQEDYRPQGNLFQLPVSVIAKRFTMLMRWWGYRPATLADLYRETRTRAGHTRHSLVLSPSREELEEWRTHVFPDIGIRTN